MRSAFVGALLELMERHSRILLLTGDLGFTVLEPFRERFPDRFFNVGVAEQNMVGLATGLAEAGFIPFVYSIATFASLRPYEFIRNGPILQRLPVRIVGIGGGFDYGTAGSSHHSLEDIGIMRIQPGISVVVPADYEQARTAILATWNLPQPVYYRIGKDEKTLIPGLKGQFDLEKAQVVREGSDLAIVAIGSVASEAVSAAKVLAGQGISCAVVVVASLNPAPIEHLAEILKNLPLAITVEAHYVVGGIGSLVSEIVAERSLQCQVVRCGAKVAPTGMFGSQAYMHQQHGISGKKLAEAACAALGVRIK